MSIDLIVFAVPFAISFATFWLIAWMQSKKNKSAKSLKRPWSWLLSFLCILMMSSIIWATASTIETAATGSENSSYCYALIIYCLLLVSCIIHFSINRKYQSSIFLSSFRKNGTNSNEPFPFFRDILLEISPMICIATISVSFTKSIPSKVYYNIVQLFKLPIRSEKVIFGCILCLSIIWNIFVFVNAIHKNKMQLSEERYLREILSISTKANTSHSFKSDNLKEVTYRFFYNISVNNSLIKKNKDSIYESTLDAIRRGSAFRYEISVPVDTKKSQGSTDDRTLDIVRDLCHATKTPLVSILGAIETLQTVADRVEGQQEYLDIISRQAKMIRYIMDGYRNLAMHMTDSSTLDIVEQLRAAGESTSSTNNKNVTMTIDSFPADVCNQGDLYAFILLKPLIDNAVEASPDGGEVVISVENTEEEYIVSVINECVVVPTQSNLEMPGFTTKEGGGEGLANVRRLAGKYNYPFSICVQPEKRKVIAEIRFPKA